MPRPLNHHTSNSASGSLWYGHLPRAYYCCLWSQQRYCAAATDHLHQNHSRSHHLLKVAPPLIQSVPVSLLLNFLSTVKRMCHRPAETPVAVNKPPPTGHIGIPSHWCSACNDDDHHGGDAGCYPTA